jgi:AcrR family transcriptional regulator
MTISAAGELSPRAREIASAARDLLEQEGPDGLSMRKVAGRLGIQAPSLYKHFPDKQALESAVISTVFEEQAETFERALKTDDPLAALAAVYRSYARHHPHVFRLMTERSLRRDQLTPGVEQRAAAPVLEAAGGDQDLARAFWAFAHGMTVLEMNGRFPADADLDAAWEHGLNAFRGSANEDC